MKKRNTIKFPKGFFQLKRPTITASKALKNEIPIKWDEKPKNKLANKNWIDTGTEMLR